MTMHPARLKKLEELRKERESIRIDSDWLQWFIGFVDGEGSFAFSRGERPYPTFQIGLQNRDINILHEIHETLKLGKIYVHGKERDVYRNGEKIFHASASSMWRINRWAELWIFAGLMDGQLKTSKRNSFPVWFDMLKLMAESSGQGGRTHGKPMGYWQQLSLLADQLSSINRGSFG